MGVVTRGEEQIFGYKTRPRFPSAPPGPHFRSILHQASVILQDVTPSIPPFIATVSRRFDEWGRSPGVPLTHSARPYIVAYMQTRSKEGALMATKKTRLSMRENSRAVGIPREFQLDGDKIDIQPLGNTPVFHPQ